MTPLEILGLISGMASIVSIPIAFYFNRKSELNRYENSKRRIIETLLFQIGSGQKIDILGMKLIIDSKLREAGLTPNKISIQEIIADLYTNVTTNPLIENHLKSKYQFEIKRLGLTHLASSTIESIRDHKLLTSGENISKDLMIKLENMNEDSQIAFLKEHHLLEMRNNYSYITKKKYQLKLFSWISSIFTILGVTISLLYYNNFINTIKTNLDPVILSLIISFVTGILITLIAYFLSYFQTKQSNITENISDYIKIDNENNY